jgi:hypothetical protein
MACATTTAFTTALEVFAPADSCASASYISVSLPRPTTLPHVFALPDPGVQLETSGFGATDGGTTYCSAWTGTITWTSDVPNWKVTFDATCSAGANNASLVGTLQGND